MATTSFTVLRRFAGFAFTLMLFSLCLTGLATGQGSPLVTASSAAGLNHPTGWGTIQETAIDQAGDWLVVDNANGALYEFPVGGGAAITLGSATPTSSLGGSQNPVVAIDPGNNLYLGANWNNCIVMFPWNAAKGNWTGLNDGGANDLSPSNPTTTMCTNSGTNNEFEAWAQYGITDLTNSGIGYFQPWAVATGNNNNLIIGEQGGSAGANVLSLAVSGGWSNPKPAGWNWAPVAGTDLTARPIAVAQDPEGNVYFVEDSGGLPGVYEIPASATNGQYTSDCPTPKTAPFTGSSCLTRVDPNLPAVKGVITDAAGNLYISDLQVGVVEVPNPSGTPETSSAVLVSGVPAEGAVAIDSARNLMYVPTSQTQANGQADVAKIGFSYAELGSSPVGQTPSVGTNVVFGFNGSVTPANFVIAENGVSKPDFAITGGTCTTGVAYAEGKSCLENVSFTPNSVGNISAKLLMQELVPSGSTISVTAYSIATSSTTLTLTAANKFSSGEIVTFTDSNSKDPLYALNAQQLTVLPSGLSATQFEVQTSLVTAFTTTGSLPASATVQGSNYVTIASMVLHGTGLGANVQTSPALVSAIGSKLVTPTQVATDAAGNVYVADPGQGKVLMYAAGSGASSTPSSVGTGLTKPTGVAVDGSGDVFIADSGSVYEVPVGQSEVTGQAPGPNPTSQVTLASGLGATGLQLAADGLDNLYIADPSNGRVVKLSAVSASTASSLGQTEAFLTAGFTAPSAVAVDANNNLYVIDGQNLFELKGGIGAPTTLLSDLSGATGLAIDPSGAIYISSASGTSRIPYVNGAFAAATPVASTVSNTSSVALDRMANVYLTQSSGGAVTVVSFDGTLTLPTPATLTSSTDAFATITNAGNSALTVTGYTNTNPLNAQQPSYLQLPADFTGSDTSTGGCEAGSPIAAGATCEVEVTFAPGAGEQGAVTGTIGVISTAINAPTTIDATGTALPLANSATTVAGGAKAAEVINTPLTITVAPKSGAGTATGTVTITYETWNVVIPSSGSNAGIPTITPVLASATSSLTNGSASFTLSPVLAGPQAITVYYSGDRTYGRSTGTLSVNVAKSAITGIKLPKFPDSTDINLPFVPAGTGSGTVPYNGDETPFQYNFIMAVGTAAGVPTGQITVMDNVTACPPGTSATGIGAAACILPGYATPGGYSGVACPNLSGDGVLTIENAGTPTGAQASFPTSCLWFVPQGVSYSPVLYTHYISPVYSGDANFLSFTGPTSTLLQSVRGPLVQITQTGNAASLTVAPSLTVQAGSSTSMNLTLTSILGYGIAGLNAQLNASNFPVSLACDNLPPHTQCSFSYPNPDPVIPNAVDIPCPSGATTTQIANGSVQCTPGQVTVTFYTDVSAGTTTSQNARTASVTLAAIFGFGMVGLFFRRRAFEKGRLLLMVLLMIVGGALAVSITACNTTTLTPGASLSTPAGTYAVTITASEAGTLCSSSPGGPGDNCIVPGSGSTSNNGILVYGSQNQVSVPFYVNVTVQ
jgi:sugar lactone lactonase YvrE